MAGEHIDKKSFFGALFDREVYRRNYWRLGFRTRLYDMFTPFAYRESLARAAHHIPGDDGLGLDAGCGSGQLISLLIERRPSLRYLGADRLQEGLVAARRRVLGNSSPIYFLRWDLAAEPPLAAACVDWVVAHFSVYTLSQRSDRLAAWRNLHRVTRPGGSLIAANPSIDYSADRIIRYSLEAERSRRGPLAYWLQRLLVAPVSRQLGLAYIERQLRQGHFHAYTLKEFREEVEMAGWRVEATETVYAGSGFLITARRV